MNSWVFARSNSPKNRTSFSKGSWLYEHLFITF
jgi:hypothetical protein